MDMVLINIAKSIIGQCEVGNVGIVVFVHNGADRAKLIDTIAYFQRPMKFEGFEHGGSKLTLFGKEILIVIAKKGAINNMKFGNRRIYNIE